MSKANIRRQLLEVLETRQDDDLLSRALRVIRQEITEDPELARSALLSETRTQGALQVLHEARSFVTVIAASLELIDQLLPTILDETVNEEERVLALADFRMAVQDAQAACQMCVELSKHGAILASKDGRAHLPQVVDLATRMFRRSMAPSLTLVAPTRVDDVWVGANAQELVQVLWNLLGNAERVLAEQANARIEVRQWATHDDVFLEVRDNGPGLPPGREDSVFELFSTSKEHGGGLGLFVCRTIVHAWKGSLEGRNEPSGGAVFTIRIPRQ